jgi:hypothetical protein
MDTLQVSLLPLTPVKAKGRKKRPSFSPVKYVASPKPRTISEQAPLKPEISEPVFHIPTAALTFSEFTFWNPVENDYDSISSKHMGQLLDYMDRKYRVDDIQHSGPFLVLRSDEVPSQDMRPFTIGGCLAIWLTRNQPLPREIMIGKRGMAAELDLAEAEARDLEPYRIPSTSTLLTIWEQFFADAEAISYVTTGIVVELPQTDFNVFLARVHTMPKRFSNSAASLSFANGPLVRDELGRRKQPQPQHIDGDFDDTDYVKEEGCFYPGCMIMNSAGGMVSAGVAVERAQDLRVTVAFHCWPDEYKESTDKLGDSEHFSITQGTTVVGNVTERIGDTDIGLAALKDGVAFNNQILGLDAAAKVLLPSNKLKYRDEFVVDGFTTSVQRLVCLGRRIRRANTRTEDLYRAGKDAELPAPGNYIILEQGIMATGEPEMRGTPRLREGVCGSALLRVQMANGEDVIQKGEIAGFMHWCDLQSVYNTEDPPPLLCYCDATDKLIEHGWKIVRAGERRKIEE